jgi:hypothetical protein
LIGLRSEKEKAKMFSLQKQKEMIKQQKKMLKGGSGSPIERSFN